MSPRRKKIDCIRPVGRNGQSIDRSENVFVEYPVRVICVVSVFNNFMHISFKSFLFFKK